MFANNPFAALAAVVPPGLMQGYVLVMFLLVVAGTLYDIAHKGSATYFFQNWRKERLKGGRQVEGGEALKIAGQTLAEDVLTSGEFCNPRRRVAHLLTMYGFIAYVVSAAVIVFRYPTGFAPTLWPMLFHLGALSVCIGGYWFWFFIRADVAAEGNSPFRIVRADLFILSLLASTTLALVWSYLQWTGSPWMPLALGLYLLATTVLFGSVPWSKFSHMFFKPAAAFQKRMANASGTRNNLPPPANQPATLGRARDHAHHY